MKLNQTKPNQTKLNQTKLSQTTRNCNELHKTNQI